MSWKIKKYKWVSKVGLVLLLVFLYNIFIYISNPYSEYWNDWRNLDIKEIISFLIISFIDCWIILESSFLITRILDKRFPWTVSPLFRFAIQSIAMIIIMLILFFLQELLFSFIWEKWVLTQQEAIESWQMSVLCIIFSLLVSAVHTIYYMLQHWKRSIEEAANLQVRTLELKEVAMQAELQALKAQLNPHFMFNNFSTLSELIDRDKNVASIFLNNLSKVYRYMIQNQKRDLISLPEEIEFVKAYFHLMHIRHEDNVNLQINLNEDALKMYIPPISVQLLIENAIKHNIASKVQPLTINISSRNNNLIVCNNLQPIATTFSSTGIGIQNIKDRYKALSSKENLSIHRSEQEYCVWLPLFDFNSYN